MLLETMLDAASCVGNTDPKALAAELRTLASEVEALAAAVSRSQLLLDDSSELQHVA